MQGLSSEVEEFIRSTNSTFTESKGPIESVLKFSGQLTLILWFWDY
jgi:hypothetical protein